MKAILQFNLPEDQIEFDTACKAVEWKLIASKMDEFLRSRIEHTTNYDEVVGLEIAQEKFWELVSEYGVMMD
jgi:hypothetical protein